MSNRSVGTIDPSQLTHVLRTFSGLIGGVGSASSALIQQAESNQLSEEIINQFTAIGHRLEGLLRRFQQMASRCWEPGAINQSTAEKFLTWGISQWKDCLDHLVALAGLVHDHVNSASGEKTKRILELLQHLQSRRTWEWRKFLASE